MNPMIWLSDEPPGHCTLGAPPLPNTRDLHNGVSVADHFPSDIVYQMSDRFPDDIILSDNFNVAGQILVSAALKAQLTSMLPDHHVEYLPVSIMNHKGRIAADDYFILHSLDMVDCIDLKKSKVKWNPLNKKVIMSCKGLVIDDAAIPEGTRLFRPEHWGVRTMVDDGLAEELMASGFSGLRFFPAAGYTGIG